MSENERLARKIVAWCHLMILMADPMKGGLTPEELVSEFTDFVRRHNLG